MACTAAKACPSRAYQSNSEEAKRTPGLTCGFRDLKIMRDHQFF
jgi:hypothetical protein